MENSANWSELGTVSPTKLSESRNVAHHALQWLGRSARALLHPKDDDSHTSLIWNDSVSGFCTQPIAAGGEELHVCLELPDLSLVVRSVGGGDVSIELDGHSDREIGEWLVAALMARGLDPSKLYDEQPYEIPTHPVAEGGIYKTAHLRTELSELAQWYAGAHAILSGVTENYALIDPGPSEVQCWPHHFDLAVLIAFESGGGEKAKAIGVGLSPGDDSYDQPYFYVNPWPHLKPENLPPLAEPGRWHTEGFVGAVAPGAEILALAKPYDMTWDFIMTAIEIGHRRLLAES